MPSPVGHALGGALVVALAWRRGVPQETAAATTPEPAQDGHRRLARPLDYAMAAALGILPDIDLLFGAHSRYTHSVGAVALVAVLASLLVRWRAPQASSAARRQRSLVLAAAYGSHLLLDALGTDRSLPVGIMAFWPFSDAFFKLPWSLFPPVPRDVFTRRFWALMPTAVLVELLVLGVPLWRVTRADRGRGSRAGQKGRPSTRVRPTCRGPAR